MPFSHRINIIFSFCLGFRILNALLLSTTFAPDEYWQSLEVAHRLAFGYGHLTWEWSAGLRSFCHPALFVLLYKILSILRLDSLPWVLYKAPLILQSLFAALTDWYLYLLARQLFSSSTAQWTLLCQWTSWFLFYTSVRTYSNSLEAMFAVFGAYHYILSSPIASNASTHACSSHSNPRTMPTAPRRGMHGGDTDHARNLSIPEHQRRWLLAAACSIVVRPSSILFWVPLGLWRVWAICRSDLSTLKGFIISGIFITRGTVFAAMLLDRAMYGRWVVVPWEFFKFNVLQKGSRQYGTHPWHWNVTQGLPAILWSFFPLLCIGIFDCCFGRTMGERSSITAWFLRKAGRPSRASPAPHLPSHHQTSLNGSPLILLCLAAISILTYSIPAHKEFRFLLPAEYFLLPFCGHAAARFWTRGPPSQRETKRHTKNMSLSRCVVALLLILQIPPALYFGMWHHSGMLTVVDLVRRSSSSALLLLPCHAMPHYSHIHAPLPLRFMDCSPKEFREDVYKMNEKERSWINVSPSQCGCPEAVSERTCFEQHPVETMEWLLRQDAEPALIVGFPSVMQRVGDILKKYSYERIENVWNCWFQTDDDIPCRVEVWAASCAAAAPTSEKDLWSSEEQ